MHPGTCRRCLLVLITCLFTTDARERVVSVQRLQLPLTNSASGVVVRKSVDPRTGRCRILSDDPRVASYEDVHRLLAAERSAQRGLYGAMDLSARQLYERIGDNEPVRVQIWVKGESIRYLSRFRATAEQMRQQSLELLRREPNERVRGIVAQHDLSPVHRSAGDFLECTVTRTRMRALAFDSSVVCIAALPEVKPCGNIVLFSALADGALNPAAHPADKGGAGLHVAVVEDGEQWHIDQVKMCLRNAAPNAMLFHKESRFYDLMNTEAWLVDNNIVTTSLSISRDPATVTAASTEFTLMDDFAYRWPCPLFCTPAGNVPIGYTSWTAEVNWQSYGALCVGSVKHWQQQAYVFDEFTATRNPEPIWGSCPGGDSACGGDRELPELLVPGSHPYAPPGEDDSPYQWAERIDSLYCSAESNPDSTYVCSTYFVNLWQGQGTSYSAPIANGMAARLISSNPSLFQNKPDCIKMALLLTAHNVEGGYWDAAEDGRDGAGVISAYDAVAYGQTCTDLTRMDTLPPVKTGFYTAEADSTLEDMTFQVRMPDTLPDDRHFRAVVVWTSNPDRANHVNALSDLDLGGFVDDNGDTYGSHSLDASVEMFDVPRSRVTAGKEYSFTLYARDIRIPQGARTDFFYLTVGWAWVRDHADSTITAIEWAVDDMRRGSGPRRVRVTARVRSAAVIEVSLAEGMSGGAYDIAVFDARGRVVAAHRVRPDSPDARRVAVPLKTPLAYGLYVVRVSADGCRTDAVACVNGGPR